MDKVKVSGKWTYPTAGTPTEDDTAFFDPNDGTNMYQSDSRFLPSGIADWAPAVASPEEENDESIYNPANVQYEPVLGLGQLWAIVGIPMEENMGNELLVARVGVLSTEPNVWVYSGIGARPDANSGSQADYYTYMIPEPATLTVLGLGALALLRRRR